MINVRVMGDVVTHVVNGVVTHSVSDVNLHYELLARTACGIRVSWMNDPTGKAGEITEHVDDPVDCMACLVNATRGP